MYNKLFIIIIAIASSANICKAQATVLSSYFGSTEEELLELLFEGRKDWCNEVNMKIYNREPSKIILTFSLGDYRLGWRIKATCYFKNGILYKLKELLRHNNINADGSMEKGVIDGNCSLFNMYESRFENEWYEKDESRGNRCCDDGHYSSYWSSPKMNVELIKILSGMKQLTISKRN